MKGFSLVTSDSIRNSQLNSSTSKHTYGFSKEQRFKLKPANCPIAFYEYPGYLSKRRASIGYGQKSDFTHSSVLSPACNTYEMQSEFRPDPKKGKTFGVSRDQSPENGIVVRDIVKFPGPGKYQCKKDTLSTISYTCRPRTLDFIQHKITFKQNPGPGAYEAVNALPGDGKTFVSKYGSSKFAKINKSPRFQDEKDSPGPLSYDTRNNFSREGKYMLSGNRGDGTRAFSQTARVGFTDTISKNSFTPGPGLYDKPSEFGVYGDSKYYKTMTGFSKNNQTIS